MNVPQDILALLHTQVDVSHSGSHSLNRLIKPDYIAMPGLGTS